MKIKVNQCERMEFDFDGSTVLDLIEYLLNFCNKRNIKFSDVKFTDESYDTSRLDLWYDRDETDVEYEKRMKEDNKEKAKEIKRQKEILDKLAQELITQNVKENN